jgi:glycosyltransferase involved in cell wall biosynthesis
MKLSIITINYNNKEGLKKTIASVRQQSIKNYEYIIIDGGSTDGSADVVKENAASLDYWVSEKDAGIFNAMNKGLAVAKGEYCLFLNSGDYLADETILKQVEPLLVEDIVYGDLYFEYADGKVVRAHYEDDMSLFKLSFTSLPHQGTFIKRSLLNKLGGYKEELKIVSDWFFFIQAIIECNPSFKKIDLVISYFDKSGVSSVTDFGYEQTSSIRKFYPFLLKEFEAYYELRNYQLSRVHQLLKKSMKVVKRTS